MRVSIKKYYNYVETIFKASLLYVTVYAAGLDSYSCWVLEGVGGVSPWGSSLYIW